MILGGMALSLLALGCGQVKSGSNELRFELEGTIVVSGGHEEGGCGAPWTYGQAVYMMEPSRKFETKYRVWMDKNEKTWLTDVVSGCTLEVESLSSIRAADAECVIAEGSTLAIWGTSEVIYPYLEVDLEMGTYRSSGRTKLIDNTGERQETCFVTEGRVVKE